MGGSFCVDVNLSMCTCNDQKVACHSERHKTGTPRSATSLGGKAKWALCLHAVVWLCICKKPGARDGGPGGESGQPAAARGSRSLPKVGEPAVRLAPRNSHGKGC